MTTALKSPFPWFGGKSRVASIVWERFGDVYNFVDPFFGAGPVLLMRPHAPRIETVNDIDCYLANFWRALKFDPEGVAYWADWPVNEADLHARHRWLVDQAVFREKMRRDPDFFDVRVAGWWVWGLSMWIGDDWCKVRDSSRRGAACRARDDGRPALQKPDLGPKRGLNAKRPNLWRGGPGVHRMSGKRVNLNRGGRGISGNVGKLPHLWRSGKGVHQVDLRGDVPNSLPDLCGRKGVHSAANDVSDRTPHTYRNRGVHTRRPVLRNAEGVHRACHGEAERSRESALLDYFFALAERLRHVRVCCGDWTRVVGPTPTFLLGLTAVFLDPPYGDRRVRKVYNFHDRDLAAEVREWAIANGSNPKLRIALCGYEGEHEMPPDWEKVAWKANGGYANHGKDRRENSARERIWFSPHCLKPEPSLFSDHEEGKP